MSPLFETIRIQNGMPMHLAWHALRMNRARKEFWGVEAGVDLDNTIKIPAGLRTGLVRCNVYYGPEIEEITYKLYEKRPVRSLKLIQVQALDYHVKYTDREKLTELLSQRGSCDDILIVTDNLVKDTSMSNVIFRDGNRWITPASPLLPGTTRERLIWEGRIFPEIITADMIPNYPGLKLINVMRYPEEEEIIPIHLVRW